MSNIHISLNNNDKHLLSPADVRFFDIHFRPQSPTIPARLSVIERNDQMPTVLKSSSLFAKASHHSVHYSFTALKRYQSWICCCPLKSVDRTKKVGSHTAETFVWNCVKLLFDSGMSLKEVTSEAAANSRSSVSQ